MLSSKIKHKITRKNLPSLPYIKQLILGILYLDKNPAFDSEAACWLDANNGVQIYAYIHPEEETWQHQFFNLIRSKEFAPFISAIEIKGPDLGTNGTRLYDLSELLKDTDTQFTHLFDFEIEQTSPSHENITMVTCDDFYEDNGAGGKILDKMPNLISLTLPSAPSPTFFERDFHPLEHLSLQAGYDHQGFISRLAHSDCFPNLKTLEWTDGPGMPLITTCTPKSHLDMLSQKKNIQIEYQTLHESRDLGKLF